MNRGKGIGMVREFGIWGKIWFYVSTELIMSDSLRRSANGANSHYQLS